MIIQVGKISKDIQQMAAKLADKLKDELIVSSDPKATALWQEKFLEHHVVLLADLNNQPSEKDFSLLTAANEKGASLLLANAKQDIVTKISGVGTDAKFVIVKSAGNQFKQEIIAILDSQNTSVEELVSESEGSQPQSEKEKLPSSNHPSLFIDPAVAVEPKEFDEVDVIAYRLQDTSFFSSEGRPPFVEQEQPRQDIRYFKLILTHAGRRSRDVRTGIDDYTYTLNSQSSAAFDVVMLVPTGGTGRKVLKITSSDQVSVTAIDAGSWDTTGFGWWDKGSINFTTRGRVFIYPGTHVSEPLNTNIPLPTGWTRPHIAPQTANSVNQYQSTTGMEISASLGWEGSTPQGSLTFTRNQSTVVTTEIQDFEVWNRSGGGLAAWEFVNTQYERNWMDTIHGIQARLARGFMAMPNEVVYETPADHNGRNDFTFTIQHGVAVTRENGRRVWPTPPVALQSRNEQLFSFHGTFSFDFSRVRRYTG